MELKIGSLIEKEEVPTDVYIIRTECMSGDADHHENSDIIVDNKETVIELLTILNAFYNLDWNSGCDQEKVRKVVEDSAHSLGWEDDDGWGWYSDYIGGDVTSNDGYIRRPTETEVIYISSDGQKFDVDVVDSKGNPIKLSRYQ